jgi:hypothetical protein
VRRERETDKRNMRHERDTRETRER